MSDVVFVLLVVAFFALAVGYVRACNALVGASASEPLADEDAGDAGEAAAA